MGGEAVKVRAQDDASASPLKLAVRRAPCRSTDSDWPSLVMVAAAGRGCYAWRCGGGGGGHAVGGGGASLGEQRAPGRVSWVSGRLQTRERARERVPIYSALTAGARMGTSRARRKASTCRAAPARQSRRPVRGGVVDKACRVPV